jgi:type II secretory pathway component PulM
MELIDKAKIQQYKARIVKILGDPVKMRLAVIFAVTVLAIGGIYYPLSGQIEEERAAVAAEKARLEVIQDVEKLRSDVTEFRSRIGEKKDTNEDWDHYLMDGTRQMGIMLRGMEKRETHAIGPYTAITQVMEVQGTFSQIQAFVEWLDKSERLLRIDNMRIEKTPGAIVMKVNVLCLVSKHA